MLIVFDYFITYLIYYSFYLGGIMFSERKIPALCLKVNVCHALVNGEKEELSASPKSENGILLIPTEALALIGIKKDGKYVAYSGIDEIEKYSDYMGLIFMDENADTVNLSVEKDLKYMMYLAHKFIFDVDFERIDTSAYAPASEGERAEFKRLGEYVSSLLKCRKNKRPYILANDNVIARLREIYTSGEASADYRMVKSLLDSTEKEKQNRFPALNEAKNGLEAPLRDSGYGEDEYDEGGRHLDSDSLLSSLRDLALASMIKSDRDDMAICYYAAKSIAERKHWGPGHFLNCSIASCSLAQIYDWLYNDWKEMNLDTGIIKRFIYTQGIHHGYNSAIFDMCDYPSPRQGTGWRFKLKRDNWNTICNGGMIVSALCLLGEDADEYVTEEMLEKTKEMLGASLTSYLQYDLLFTQYAPDGSYIESNSYWSYGTNMLAKTLGALYTALGNDLGIHNACGLDMTCYYAINTESADLVGWNYHDGHLSAQDTGSFGLFATLFNDDKLYSIRKSHILSGKGVTPEDLLFCAYAWNRSEPKLDEMPLDYHMKGIDAFTVRSGWSKGSLFAGIIGGENAIGGSHNHIDSGAFVYHNYGKMWICDLGCDNYNVAKVNNISYFGNYTLYKRNGEGHNIINLISLPYGQLEGKSGRITECRCGKNASYCIIDNKEVYGERAKHAERGMLLLDRKSLIIADRVEFNGNEDAFWSAHFDSSKITAAIADDGKSCIMTQDEETITLSLLSKDGKFEIMNCYDFLLSSTSYTEGEHSRENLSRIVIKYNGVKNIDAVIAIEGKNIDSSAMNMDEWKKLS